MIFQREESFGEINKSAYMKKRKIILAFAETP